MPTAKLRALWRNVYDSLWFLPTLATILAIIIAALLVRADPLLPESLDRRAIAWLFSGGAEGARGVLGAIASSLITVTGVVFSITIVALQLSSSQYTPRVMRTFMADRANQLVLAVFIGTFVYALLVMRTIHGGTATVAPAVPAIATTFGVVLAVISIGFLIFYIHHAAASLQIETIMRNVAAETLRTIREVYPETGPDETDGPVPDGPGHAVIAHECGYISTVDETGLLAIARKTGGIVRIDVRVGDFVYAGSRLATLWQRSEGEDVVSATCNAFATNTVRTPHQDMGLGFVELVDIGVKALSPGINDPTTAMNAIDRLGELVLELGTRSRRAARRAEDGAMIVLDLPTYEEVLRLAFDQITHFGAENAAVMEHIALTLGRVGALLPAARRAAIADQLRRVRTVALHRLTLEMDRASMERALQSAMSMTKE